jgi:GntR family transcriptional regulator of arabinose operon
MYSSAPDLPSFLRDKNLVYLLFRMTRMGAPTKHRRVRAALLQDIESGRWPPGARLPSEAQLVRQFGVSRITVVRAVNDLQAAGVVERHAGSGTFVRKPSKGAALSFGLLIPELGETDIFDPICKGIMASPHAREHALLWGSTSGLEAESRGTRAWHLCQQYIERGVSGIFFAPLETEPAPDRLNVRIGHALDEANIPLVLLDRSILPYPQQGRYDLVGIDNRSAGFEVTQHLLTQGAKRVAFIGIKHGASTIDAREAGYRDALYAADCTIERDLIHRGEPDDLAAIQRLLKVHKADGIVCANDRTAGRVMHALRRLGSRVPEDVRLVGIDDAEYASLLPVPLTTLRQPTGKIGDVALSVMLQRIERPDLPPRDTRLKCELIVRESCGAQIAQAM